MVETQIEIQQGNSHLLIQWNSLVAICFSLLEAVQKLIVVRMQSPLNLKELAEQIHIKRDPYTIQVPNKQQLCLSNKLHLYHLIW